MRSNRPFRWSATLLLGGLTAAIWVADPVAQETGNEFTTPIDARMGGRAFRRDCSRCHGMDAKGSDEGGGPDLTTGTFQNASTDLGLFQVIREGVDGTEMIGISRRTSDQTVWQIVTYLDGLGVDPNIEVPGDVAAGRQLFTGAGNCSSCHMVNGDGGRLGPDLSDVASRRDPAELRSDLLTPGEDLAPRWWTMRVTREDGSVVEGLRMSEDTFTIRIIDEDENLWSFSKGQIRSFERVKETTMPSASTLSAGQVDDLVAYLFSLRKES